MSSDLWDFAQRLYAQPGAEPLFLRLQAGGADVCLLLTALWLEQRQAACTDARCTALQAIARPWQHEVVKPLRHLRINWREAALRDEPLAGLREQIKALEVQAERALLLHLEQHCKTWRQEEKGDWLGKLAATAGKDNRDALEALRIAAAQT